MSKESLPEHRILSQLGIATKAGKLVSGEFMAEKMIKENKAFLVIVAEDASDNTKKNFSDMCSYRNVPILFFGTKEEIGKSIGKQMRASVAITDEGFAKSISEKVRASRLREDKI
ncbi:MAG: ribosomal L7Ae/L30e/S12e/Gadd45 family protein [Lachnospiraceae bacterium]|nr:ribosomal L7Ae/L30e/S12e/Gadd45 family protein [Lachnospiraceae bacterium]